MLPVSFTVNPVDLSQHHLIKGEKWEFGGGPRSPPNSDPPDFKEVFYRKKARSCPLRVHKKITSRIAQDGAAAEAERG
jgi:hypothetical protein